MGVKIRNAVKKLPGYALRQERCPIKLDQNESPYDLPAELKSEIVARLAECPWNRYPTPYADSLREKLATLNKWDPEGILVASGSNVLTQAIVAVTALNGKLVLPNPTFALYELYGRLYNNKIYRVPLTHDFCLEPQALIRKIKAQRPELVFVANPNAPTGRLLPTTTLEDIIAASPGTVVVDEAYFPYSGETILPQLARSKNLVILRTFSKAFSLGGVRLGYVLADPAWTGELKKALPPFNVSVVAALIASVVLDHPSYVMKRVTETVAEREKVFQALTQLPELEAFPSSANFILFRSRKARALYEGLIGKGILIRNVSDGRRLRNCLRVTIGSPTENEQFLSAMRQLL